MQLIPEPWLTGYMSRDALERYALPHYTPEELARATHAQKRFLIDRKLVSRESGDWFTDPDVLACQKQYLEEALAWVAGEPQVFALELYNEQGSGPDEAAELKWTEEIVRFIKQQPEMPVTISHPGSGLTAFDPLKWSRLAGVDFYSSHLYAGQCGENAQIDFAAVTGATDGGAARRNRKLPRRMGGARQQGPARDPAPQPPRCALAEPHGGRPRFHAVDLRLSG